MAEKKERTLTPAGEAPAKKVTRAAEPKAEPEKKAEAPKESKPKTVTTPSGKTAKESAPVGNATGLRIGAIALWVCAIACEVLAILIAVGKINWTFMATTWQLIIAIVLDLVFVIIGSQLWKKANRISPASKKNKLKFWLWNNMGLIVTVLAFVPLIIILLTNKNLDKKTKTIATVAAIIALLIGGLASYDWNPVSKEDKDTAVQYVTDTVYWTPFGTVYHIDEDCFHLNHSDNLTYGTVEEAIAANKSRLCKSCATRHSINENVVTDDAED